RDAAAADRQARGEVGSGDRLKVADMSQGLELGDGDAELPQVLLRDLIAVLHEAGHPKPDERAEWQVLHCASHCCAIDGSWPSNISSIIRVGPSRTASPVRSGADAHVDVLDTRLRPRRWSVSSVAGSRPRSGRSESGRAARAKARTMPIPVSVATSDEPP